MSRPPLPADHVRIHALIGRPRRLHPCCVHWASPCRERHYLPEKPGMTGYRCATALWAAVEAGVFPQPARGAFGVAWRLTDITSSRST